MWDLESRSRQTAKVNMYHVTKCSLSLCFTVHYFYPKISSFRLAWSIAIVLDCLSCSYSILRNSKLASDVSISLTNVWSAARKRRSWTYDFTFTRDLLFTILYTHVKITRQSKSTFIRRHVAYITVAALKGGRKSGGKSARVRKEENRFLPIRPSMSLPKSFCLFSCFYSVKQQRVWS